MKDSIPHAERNLGSQYSVQKVKAHQMCTVILYKQRRLPMSGIIRKDDTQE